MSKYSKQEMTISFEVSSLELTFAAEVSYYPEVPGRYSGPPEDCYPAEGGEIEIQTLTYNGKDAMFLLESALEDEIRDAAREAAEEWVQDKSEEYEP